MREGKEGGGKGPLIQEDRSAALATGNNQVLITPSTEPIPILEAGARNGRGAPDDVCPPLKAESGETGKGDGAPLVFDPNQVTNKDNRSQPQPGGPCHTLPNQSQPPMLAFNVYPKSGQGAKLEASETDVANAVSPTQGEKMTDRGTRLASTAAVRRLTPRECERLQGFPDDYTRVATFVIRHKRTCPTMVDVEWDDQSDAIIDLRVEVVGPTEALIAECGCDIRKTEASDCPDGPRYKACGNSMAVPVMNWIGTRIQQFEDSVRENTK